MPMNDSKDYSAIMISATACDGNASYTESQYFQNPRWYLLLTQKPGYAYHHALGVRLCI